MTRLSLNRGNKYSNIPTVYNGRRYASKKEAQRAFELDMLTKAKEVDHFEVQVPFVFKLNDVKICTYLADFVVHWTNGNVTVEDVKGVRTSVYIIKRKMMKAFYSIDIVEI